MATHAHFPAKSEIVAQDQAVEKVLIINNGLVRLVHVGPNGERYIAGFLGPGDMLGSVRIGDSSYCSADAITEVSACGFPKKHFRAFLERHSVLCLEVLTIAMDEIECLHNRSALLCRKSATHRVAAFLLEMVRRWPSADGAADVVGIPMTRNDIADYLGLTPETLSRTLGRFRRERCIAFEGPKRLRITNVPYLEMVAGVNVVPERPMGIGF